jgi:hypothetical protein
VVATATVRWGLVEQPAQEVRAEAKPAEWMYETLRLYDTASGRALLRKVRQRSTQK